MGRACQASLDLRLRRAAARVWTTLDGPRKTKKMRPLIQLVLIVINLYWWVVIAQVIMSWLVAFGVINTYNRIVAQIGEVLYRLTEPALRPIRKLLPNFGGIDISPMVLILLLWLIQREIEEYLLPYSF
jgi:YggT family protein